MQIQSVEEKNDLTPRKSLTQTNGTQQFFFLIEWLLLAAFVLRGVLISDADLSRKISCSHLLVRSKIRISANVVFVLRVSRTVRRAKRQEMNLGDIR